jgi:hypothetical protein
MQWNLPAGPRGEEFRGGSHLKCCYDVLYGDVAYGHVKTAGGARKPAAHMIVNRVTENIAILRQRFDDPVILLFIPIRPSQRKSFYECSQLWTCVRVLLWVSLIQAKYSVFGAHYEHGVYKGIEATPYILPICALAPRSARIGARAECSLSDRGQVDTIILERRSSLSSHFLRCPE